MALTSINGVGALSNFYRDATSHGLEAAPRTYTNTCLIGAPTSTRLPSSIPEVWRTLIESVAPEYPDVDQRLVAAVLWVENRGWPEFRESGWAESGSGARGPFQFIAGTWFGWGGTIPSWDRYTDESAYRPNALGTDGDGDGIRDPNNPIDSVHAAFKHHRDSANLPIVEGYSGDPEDSYNRARFYRDGQNLLSYLSAYNGTPSSAPPNGTVLAQFPRGENPDYIIMGYWLLASSFQTVFMPELGEFVNAATHNNRTGQGEAGATVINFCNAEQGIVNTEGYSFPVGGNTADIRSLTFLPCTADPETGCHWDESPAFDLFLDTTCPRETVETRPCAEEDFNDRETIGVPVFAITSGQIDNLVTTYNGEEGCNAFQLRGDDGWSYWYGHIQRVPQEDEEYVQAGEVVGYIGEPRCTNDGEGNTSIPHLHIDRGSPQGENGGRECCRDVDFIDLINSLYTERVQLS